MGAISFVTIEARPLASETALRGWLGTTRPRWGRGQTVNRLTCGMGLGTLWLGAMGRPDPTISKDWIDAHGTGAELGLLGE